MEIFIENARMFGRHGVLEQERQVGNEFIVNLTIKTTVSDEMRNDCLEGTVSYADLYDIVAQEMAHPRQLLEKLAIDIADRICREFPSQVECGSITITKSTPPISGISGSAGVRHFF